MTPKVFAQAIVSIEHNYGLRLDARSAWLRLDEFKKVKELAGGKCNEAKGWYGLKGACKRGKKGEGEARSKESKVDIAGRIRERKGMGEKKRSEKVATATTRKVLKEVIPTTAGTIDPKSIKKGDVLEIRGTAKKEYIPYEFHSASEGNMKFIGRDDRSQFTTLEPSDIADLESYGLLRKGEKSKKKETADKKTGYVPGKTVFTAIGANDVLKESNMGLAKNLGEEYEYQGRTKEGSLVLLGKKSGTAGIRIMEDHELADHIKSGQVKKMKT